MSNKLRTSLFSQLLEKHILCVYIYNQIYMHISISRDIHHIVDTRVLKHTSTWALFPILTIITIPERVTTCIFPIHLQDSKIHEDNCSVFPMLKNCSWKACMALGIKQLRPHKSYFVALNSLKLSLLSVDVPLIWTHLNTKGKTFKC